MPLPTRIFITGASAGIGEALVRHYARADAVIGMAARRRERMEAIAAQLPGRSALYPLDVSDSAAVIGAARDFVARFGAPDLVIANAGVSFGTLGESARDLDALRTVLATNVIGLAATLGAFVPAMRAAGRGTLVGISSVAGFRGIPGSGAYSASKAAATTWLESLRAELAGSGVSVIAVCPGYVDTDMTRRNGFRMPFLLPADDAARRIARAIAARRRVAVIPWQMALVSLGLRAMPGWLFDRLAARAPRKPR